MLMFLVPVFQNLFVQLHGELRTLTKIIVALSNLVRGYWFVIFPLIGGAIYGFRRWKRTPAGRRVGDRFKLRIPAGIGKGVLKGTMARFPRTLPTLIAPRGQIIKGVE